MAYEEGLLHFLYYIKSIMEAKGAQGFSRLGVAFSAAVARHEPSGAFSGGGGGGVGVVATTKAMMVETSLGSSVFDLIGSRNGPPRTFDLPGLLLHHRILLLKVLLMRLLLLCFCFGRYQSLCGTCLQV